MENQKIVEDFVKQTIEVKKKFVKRLDSHIDQASKLNFPNAGEFLEYFWNKEVILEFVSEIGGPKPISHFERFIQLKDINAEAIYKIHIETGFKYQERVILTTNTGRLIDDKRVGLVLLENARKLFDQYCVGNNPIVKIQIYVLFRNAYISSMKTVRLQQDVEGEMDKTFNDKKVPERLEFEQRIEDLYKQGVPFENSEMVGDEDEQLDNSESDEEKKK